MNSNDIDIFSPNDAFVHLAKLNDNEDEEQKIRLVDTHCHAHLEGERQDEYHLTENIMNRRLQEQLVVISLTCSVEQADWQRTLDYASQSNSILPGLGIHPWYLANLSDDWLIQLESLLLQHPSAFVGEIGLCKMAKFVRTHPQGKTVALQQQRHVFVAQMRLAARLRRPVSVHCVKQHGVFLSVLQELISDAQNDSLSEIALPPAIGMHSFTGTCHKVKELLDFEKTLSLQSPLFYFGFSHAINYAMCSSKKSQQQGQNAVRAVPFDRLVAESDVHASSDVAAGTAGALAYLAWALEKPLEQVARQCAFNGIAFLQRHIP